MKTALRTSKDWSGEAKLPLPSLRNSLNRRLTLAKDAPTGLPLELLRWRRK